MAAESLTRESIHPASRTLDPSDSIAEAGDGLLVRTAQRAQAVNLGAEGVLFLPRRRRDIADGGQALVAVVDAVVELVELLGGTLAQSVRVVRLLGDHSGRGRSLSLTLLNLSHPSRD